MNRFAASFLIALVLAAPLFAAPRTIHVSPSGSDKADGSADRLLKTLEKAMTLAMSGDTIELAAGQYEGDVRK